MNTDFNKNAEEAHSSLFDAIGKGDTASVTRLLADHPEATGWKNSAGANPLMAAMNQRNEELAKLLIEKGCDINHKDNDDWTPLIRAVDKGLPDIVKILIDKGANLEDRIASSEMTPLLVAAMMDRGACALILLQAGASTQMRDNRNLTPADWARRGKHFATAEMIDEFPARQEAQRLVAKAAEVEAIGIAAQDGIAAPLHVGKPLKLKS